MFSPLLFNVHKFVIKKASLENSQTKQVAKTELKSQNMRYKIQIKHKKNPGRASDSRSANQLVNYLWLFCVL